MKFRWFVICLLLLALPSVLYARWSKNTVNIEGKSFGTVVFNHGDHFDYLGTKVCSTCHQEIFALKREKNPEFTMKDMEEGKACGACHNGDMAFGVDSNCASCHPTKDITFKVPATGPVSFSHDVHTSMFGCDSCHPDLYIPAPVNKSVSMDQMNKGESCGACHDGSTAFSVADDCTTCHPTKNVTFKVPATGPVTFSHDIHTSMFGCDSCHPDLYIPGPGNKVATMDQMAEGESCGACHDGSSAFSTADDCSSCHPTKDVTFEVPDVGPVVFSHDVHTSMFGCDSCHPDVFIPGPGNEPASMDQMSEGESCGACHDGSTAFSVEEDCESCHEM